MCNVIFCGIYSIEIGPCSQNHDLSVINTVRCGCDEFQYRSDDEHISLLAEYKAKFESPKGTPYLALTGELRGVFCEGLGLAITWTRAVTSNRVIGLG